MRDVPSPAMRLPDRPRQTMADEGQEVSLPAIWKQRRFLAGMSLGSAGVAGPFGFILARRCGHVRRRLFQRLLHI